MTDDRLIVALDVPNAVQGLALAEKLGDAVSFYKIGLGMLTGGGLALANEVVWRTMSEETWVYYKTFGDTAILFLFFMTQGKLLQTYAMDAEEEGTET